MNHPSHRTFNTFTFMALALMSFAARAKDVETVTRKVTVMSYNVENLFDTVHDEGKEDWAYLPLSTKRSDPRHQAACAKVSNPTFKRDCLDLDWSAQALQTKVKNIASVISTSFEGQGPDIALFNEVENFNALEELQKNGLRNKGYKEIVLIEGPDSRGIDVAILSRLPLIATRSHEVTLPEQNGKPAHPTRSILEATFKIGNKKLTVFVNHWPSQSNPTENRVAAAKVLVKAALAADARGESVLAMGDFNSLREELNGPVGAVLQNDFVDGIEERLADKTQKMAMPGSHWFKGSWSFLDRAFVLQNSLDNQGMKIDWTDLDVHAPDFALRVNEYRRRDGSVVKTHIPYRFDAKQRTGFSDHLPLVLELSL